MLFIGATLTTGFQATSLIGNPLKNRAPSAVMVHKYLDVPEARSAWLAKQEEPWGPKFVEMIGNVVPTNTDEAAAKAAWLPVALYFVASSRSATEMLALAPCPPRVARGGWLRSY